MLANARVLYGYVIVLLFVAVTVGGCAFETPADRNLENLKAENSDFEIRNVSVSREDGVPSPIRQTRRAEEIRSPIAPTPQNASLDAKSIQLDHDGDAGSPFPPDKCTGKQKTSSNHSPLSYALPELTAEQKQKRYETLVQSIEGSSPTGSTLRFQPTIDPESLTASDIVSFEEAEFWSFRRLAPTAEPAVDDLTFRIANPIDAFIAKELIANGLQQNPVAAASDLVRRVHYDTVGLPPSQEQHQALAARMNDNSYSELVDELLTNKAFGERWSRFWLDLARYADSDGYEEDDLRPRAFTFRDFSIWAMNADLPFKLFIQWQIAGDQLEPSNPMAVAATGFLAGSPINTFFPQESERYDELDDMVSTMGRAMLGITIGCSRCHDHEYDPIPAEDYYSLVSVFRTTERAHPYLLPDAGRSYEQVTAPVMDRRSEILQILLNSLKEQNINELEDFSDADKELLRQPVDPSNEKQARLLSLCMRCIWVEVEHLEHDTLVEDQFTERYDELVKAIDELAPSMPPPAPTGLCVRGGECEPFFVLQGGDLKQKSTPVNPGFLTALTKSTPKWERDTWRQWAPSHIDSTELYPRTALAVWLTDTENGAGALLARVIVNRLWQQYFGRGIVETPSDFGLLGSSPSHPELLEWLANELVANEWSLRHIHRLILNSETYKLSCDDNSVYATSDPSNTLLWRQTPRRLTAEMLRDSMLSIGGNLNRKMYGPGIMPQIPRAAILNTQVSASETWPMLHSDDPESFRRSLYIVTKRSMSVPLMKLFDAPDGSISCETRTTTTVPTQALAIWNSRFVRDQSKRVSQSLMDAVDKGPSVDHVITAAYQQILFRIPTSDELKRSEDFLGSLPNDSLVEKLTELCHVLLMTNEFVYLP